MITESDSEDDSTMVSSAELVYYSILHVRIFLKKCKIWRNIAWSP